MRGKHSNSRTRSFSSESRKDSDSYERDEKASYSKFSPLLPFLALNIGLASLHNNNKMVSNSYAIVITNQWTKIYTKGIRKIDTGRQMEKGRGERWNERKEKRRSILTSSISFTMEERASRKEGR